MRNPASKVPRICRNTPVGKRLKTVLEPRFNGSKVVLESVGQLDIQERIESYAPFSDINYMLHRLKVGDRSVLSVTPPQYGDFTGLSTNPVDVINLVHSAESNFSELDTAEKLKYNNDWRVWLASLFNSAPNSQPTLPDASGISDVGLNPVPDDSKEEVK